MPPRLALLAALCLAASLPAQTTSSDLAAQVIAITHETAVARTHWGVMVTAMDGTPIFAMNEGQLFQPASNTKLFTTAAALALLQGGSRFETRVVAQTAPTAGVLYGDLILIGDGDANLSGRAIPYAGPPAKQFPLPPLHILDQMADTLAATGLKRIAGNIVGDDTFFPWEPYAPDWAADDLLWGYGAPVSALSVNDNELKLTITPGKFPPGYGTNRAEGRVSPVIAIDPATPFYSIQNDALTTDPKTRTSIGIEREPGSRVLRVYGSIAEDAAPETYELAIDDPAAYAASSLKISLEARGIAITGKAIARHQPPTSAIGFLEQTRIPVADLGSGSTGAIAPCLRCNRVIRSYGEGIVLVRHSSPTVAEDVILTNKESLNLHAELLLHQLAAAFADDGSTAQGARVVRSFLVNAGVDPGEFVFFDGSGLSGHDLVTPRAVAKLLRFASTQPWFAVYKASLPVGGVDGSLESRFTKPPLKGHIFAKTGTNSETRALSGYLECTSGRTVIFSILAGDHYPSTSADREAMDRIVAAIAAAN